VDSVIVHWLFNEFKQSNVSVNQTIDMGLIISGITTNNSEKDFNLSVFPNPTSNQINMKFALSDHSFVQIRILDLDGKLINTIYSGELTKGMNEISWNLRDKENEQITAGIYFVQMISDNYSIVRKVVVIGN
jgi:flagellar hook assembly protein FlgD